MLDFTKCGFCGSSGTKLVAIQPSGSSFKQNSVSCASCNSILGVTGYFDAGMMIKKQEQQIADLRQQVVGLAHDIGQIASLLSQQPQKSS